MSVTIRWRPINDNGFNFNGGTSDDLAALERAFPRKTIGKTDVTTLRAMARAMQRKFFDEVADAVELTKDSEGIDFWGEW